MVIAGYTSSETHRQGTVAALVKLGPPINPVLAHRHGVSYSLDTLNGRLMNRREVHLFRHPAEQGA